MPRFTRNRCDANHLQAWRGTPPRNAGTLPASLP